MSSADAPVATGEVSSADAPVATGVSEASGTGLGAGVGSVLPSVRRAHGFGAQSEVEPVFPSVLPSVPSASGARSPPVSNSCSVDGNTRSKSSSQLSRPAHRVQKQLIVRFSEPDMHGGRSPPPVCPSISPSHVAPPELPVDSSVGSGVPSTPTHSPRGRIMSTPGVAAIAAKLTSSSE